MVAHYLILIGFQTVPTLVVVIYVLAWKTMDNGLTWHVTLNIRLYAKLTKVLSFLIPLEYQY